MKRNILMMVACLYALTTWCQQAARINIDANSMKAPTKYVPQETTLSDITDHYQLELEPYSNSILRLKDLEGTGC